MRISEYFFSIQGEGIFSGKYAFFVRLFGCNLKCKGFGVEKISPKNDKIVGCDTLRAVHEDFSSHEMSAKELINILQNANFHNKPLIVITGGEPLLWYKDNELCEFVKFCLESDFLVQFETNGTIFLDFENYEFYKKCFFAVSVKLSNSKESKEKRIKPKAIKNIFQNSNAFYKFVVSSNSDFGEIDEVLSLQNGEVWCMSLCEKEKELKKTARNLANLCIKRGFSYSDRLQIRLWDDKEGV